MGFELVVPGFVFPPVVVGLRQHLGRRLRGVGDRGHQADQLPFTVFAPTNAAIQAAITPSDIAATVNTHIVNGTTVLLIADLRDLAGTELDFVQQGPHEVTVSGDTVSIGGKQIVVTDVEASNGVIQVINGVLSPTL